MRDNLNEKLKSIENEINQPSTITPDKASDLVNEIQKVVNEVDNQNLVTPLGTTTTQEPPLTFEAVKEKIQQLEEKIQSLPEDMKSSIEQSMQMVQDKAEYPGLIRLVFQEISNQNRRGIAAIR